MEDAVIELIERQIVAIEQQVEELDWLIEEFGPDSKKVADKKIFIHGLRGSAREMNVMMTEDQKDRFFSCSLGASRQKEIV